MRNWDDVKQELSKINDTSKSIIEEVDALVSIITAITDRRHELGYSQRDLANLCDLPQSTIARIETNIVKPNLETVLKVMRPLGLSLSVVSIEN